MKSRNGLLFIVHVLLQFRRNGFEVSVSVGGTGPGLLYSVLEAVFGIFVSGHGHLALNFKKIPKSIFSCNFDAIEIEGSHVW